jgi:hypothetical protein
LCVVGSTRGRICSPSRRPTSRTCTGVVVDARVYIIGPTLDAPDGSVSARLENRHALAPRSAGRGAASIRAVSTRESGVRANGSSSARPAPKTRSWCASRARRQGPAIPDRHDIERHRAQRCGLGSRPSA